MMGQTSSDCNGPHRMERGKSDGRISNDKSCRRWRSSTSAIELMSSKNPNIKKRKYWKSGRFHGRIPLFRECFWMIFPNKSLRNPKETCSKGVEFEDDAYSEDDKVAEEGSSLCEGDEVEDTDNGLPPFVQARL
ncbi:hypothetical protein MRB53_000076 [Persea americana]|uniref:Uncharacterized protein n=1 Tax=Persea americana TaxID=3435 RepID=A0ACC2MNV1_PERAE|nr:hypothetical protein MRB53_000076 [Persea americana]